jgi:phosphoglycerol transferase MdoB-like AlkP superfamily enzyme
MLRAARGPLLDSIRHHLTLQNLAALSLVAGAGILFPALLMRLKLKAGDALILIALAFVAAGPLAVSRVETAGLHRNALGALFPASLPRAAEQTVSRDWRASPFESPGTEDLSPYRGAAAGRNVVLVALESVGARYLRPYGAAEDPMPQFTRLAGHSILFENAYAVYPESIKGLFSVLCSRSPAFGTAPEEYGKVSCPSLPQVLSTAGYRTALFHSGRFMYLGMESIIENRGFQTLDDAGAIGGNFESSFGVDEPATVGRILSWIDSLPRGQRFFATYLPIAGHHPYSTPVAGPFRADREIDRYRNALHYGDEALGALLNGFRARGLERNTLFVLYGDHAEAFGQHDGNAGHTLFLYEENVRVPFMLSMPGIQEVGLRVRKTASLIDTAPTILDLLGLEVPPEFQGHSLLRPGNRMALFFTDYSLGFLGLRDGCWKYIYEIDSSRSKLFDLCEDPEETHNLSAQFPHRVQSYNQILQGWSTSQTLH